MSSLGAIVLVVSLAAAPEQAATAPLARSPNVQFRTLEPKQFPDALRHELVLYPAVPQVGGTFTSHWGTSFTYVFHITEWLGLRAQPFFNWSATPSQFDREILGSVRQDASAASSVLLRYGAVAGPEWAPISGKFAAFGRWTVRYSLVLFAGGGIGSTRIELKAADSVGPATYGDTGTRPLVSGGAGIRAQVGSRFTVRLEIQDLVHWGSVDRINGCTPQDLQTLLDQRAAGQPLSGTGVGSGCNVGKFQGTVGGWDRANDLATARSRASEGGGDTLNVLGVYLGIGVEL
jgi:hypothetical protein